MLLLWIRHCARSKERHESQALALRHSESSPVQSVSAYRAVCEMPQGSWRRGIMLSLRGSGRASEGRQTGTKHQSSFLALALFPSLRWLLNVIIFCQGKNRKLSFSFNLSMQQRLFYEYSWILRHWNLHEVISDVSTIKFGGLLEGILFDMDCLNSLTRCSIIVRFSSPGCNGAGFS